MEVHFTPEQEAQLVEIANQAAHPLDSWIKKLAARYFRAAVQPRAAVST